MLVRARNLIKEHPNCDIAAVELSSEFFQVLLIYRPGSHKEWLVHDMLRARTLMLLRLVVLSLCVVLYSQLLVLLLQSLICITQYPALLAWLLVLCFQLPGICFRLFLPFCIWSSVSASMKGALDPLV